MSAEGRISISSHITHLPPLSVRAKEMGQGSFYEKEKKEHLFLLQSVIYFNPALLYYSIIFYLFYEF